MSETTTPILLNYHQVYDNASTIGLKYCYIVNEGMYWKDPPGTGRTTYREQAWKAQVSRALGHGNSGVLFELVDQETAALLSKRKCSIVRLLGSDLDSMLQEFPQNLVFRTHILAKGGRMPPDDLITYEALKEWVEANCEYVKDSARSGMPVPFIPIAPRPETNAFEVEVSFSETQSGRCRYSVRAHGSADWTVTLENMQELLGSCTTIEEMAESLKDQILCDPWIDLEPECDPSDGDYDYENHELDESSNHESCLTNGNRGLMAQITNYLRSTQPPEVLTRLGIQPPPR